MKIQGLSYQTVQRFNFICFGVVDVVVLVVDDDDDDVLNVVVVVVAVYDDNDVVYVVADVDFVKIIMLLYVMMFQMIKLL